MLNKIILLTIDLKKGKEGKEGGFDQTVCLNCSFLPIMSQDNFSSSSPSVNAMAKLSI
jgi:hypothetical protein